MATAITGEPVTPAFQPTDQQLIEWLQQHAVFGETQRYRELDRREAFAKCLEYQHQATDWYGMPADAMETISAGAIYPAGTQPAGGELPAREKRPTAPTRKAKTIHQRFTDMLFSEQRRPKIVVDQDEDSSAFLEAAMEAGRFWPAMRDARNKGGAMKAVVVTCHLRQARWQFEVHNIKNCTPVWRDRRTWQLAGLLIMVRTQREEPMFDKDGKPTGDAQKVDYLQRRIITENDEIVYKEVRVSDAQADPYRWEIEPGLTINHKLGRFPGVWIQNIADGEDEDGGGGDLDGAYQTVDSNDRLIAQMIYSTLSNLDPTVVTATDPKAVAQAGPGGLQKGSQYAIEVGVGGRAEYMEMTGAGVDTGLKLSEKLERQIDLITGAVFPDDQDVANAQSAKAIELRFAPMISRCDDLRGQYGAAIIELARLIVFIARRFMDTTVELPPGPNGIRRIGKFRFDMPMRKVHKVNEDGSTVDAIADHKLGDGGFISLKWGPYFPPTEKDIGDMIQNSSAAVASRFITVETGARRIAPIFGVQNVDGEVGKAREESEQDAERALAGYEGGVKMERSIVEGAGTAAGDAEKGDATPGAGEGGKP